MQCVFYEYVFLFEIHKEDGIVLNTAQHGLIASLGLTQSPLRKGKEREVEIDR